MKEELKTLKDMRFRKKDVSICCAVNLATAEEEIKAEAIKDIEIINDAVDNEKDLPFLHSPNLDEADAINSYIVWKNNITKEELK